MPVAMRLGMLGMWHTHAAGIVRQAAAHPDEFQLLGIWDPEPEVVARRREDWKGLLPGIHVFQSPEEVLALDLDGVVVEGRVHENLRWARLALERGLPVLLEKPAGTDRAAHRSLVELARAKGLRVQMLYLFRYMSAVREMLRRVRSGALGQVYEFRARLPKELSTYRRFEEELKDYRGGIFFEMAGHMIDLMVAILGPPRRVVPHLGHHHTVPGTYVDHGLAVFEFERAFGVIEVPGLEVAPRSRRFEVYGTKGACVIPHLGSGHLENEPVQPIEVCEEGKADWQRLDLPAATLQIADLREFAACVAGRKEPEFSFEHDLAVEEALLAASGMG